MQYQPSSSPLEILRNLFSRRVGDARLAYLGDSDLPGGRVDVPGKPGYVYVRFPSGKAPSGYGSKDSLTVARSAGVAFPNYCGCPVYVAFRYNNELEVVSAHYAALDRVGINTSVLNPLNQQSRFVYPWQLTYGLANAVATALSSSTLITVKSFRHFVGNVFQTYETPTAADKIDLASSIPSAGNHRYAAIWIDTYTNLPVVTTSTSQALSTPLDLTDIQELVANRPADAMPLKAFYLANAQATIRQTSQESDLRQHMATPHLWGFPRIIDHLERIWDNRVVVTGEYTFSGIGALALMPGARIIIAHKNNFIATTAPGSGNDSSQEYTVGSLWFDTLTGLLYVATSVGVGTATWAGIAASGASSPPFVDTTALVKGSADATKLLRFEVDGFTTGVTRVMTPPDYDGTIVTLAGVEALTNKTLTSPVINTGVSGSAISNDATFASPSSTIVPTTNAVKGYVDQTVLGLNAKADVRLATAAALPAVIYANGSSGVGATLTAVSIGVLTIDGVTVALNDRLLIKDQVAGLQNGIYKCTVAGAIGVAFVLTRATDGDTDAELRGGWMISIEGTANATQAWVNTNVSAITFGTTAITFGEFSAGVIAAGDGLTKTGNALAVNSTVIRTTGPQSIANGLTLVTPVIASLTNAQHNHSNAAGGGNITGAAFGTQAVHLFLVGPDSGSPANPTFRGITSDDLGSAIEVPNLASVIAYETFNPTATEDGASGYLTGYWWINITTNQVFQSTDDAAGAAVWRWLSDFNITAHNAVIGGGSAGLTSLAPGTSRNVMISDGTDWASRALALADVPNLIAILRDEKTTGTNGGTSVTTTWNNRDLNTELYDPGSIVSISSNQFTPIAGDYEILVFAPFTGGTAAQSNGRCRLYNVTGAASVEEGMSTFAILNGSTIATLNCKFTANGSSAYRIDTYTSVGRATTGLGVATSDGSAEVYTCIYLRRIA